jgi:hypothetical protein
MTSAMNYMQIGENDTEASPLSRGAGAEPVAPAAESKTWNRTNLLILIVSAFALFFIGTSLVSYSDSTALPIEAKINGKARKK